MRLPVWPKRSTPSGATRWPTTPPSQLSDAGAASQNLVLAGTALGLAAALVTDFYDAEMASILGLGGKGEWPLCLVTVGV